MVVGVDPPQGIAFWGAEGPMFLTETKSREHTAVRFVDRFTERFLGRERPLVLCQVERAYGRIHDGTTIESILTQAESAGWWECRLHPVYTRYPVSRERASTWRSRIGIKGGDSAHQDKMVERLIHGCYEQLGIPFPSPRGGKWGHGCNAMAMALSVYLKFTHPHVHARGDVAWRWKMTGRFNGDL